MKVSSIFLAALSGVGMVSARYAMYVDHYVIMAFLPANAFTSDPHGNFTLFESLETFKPRFNRLAKIMVAIGGWGDNGFHDAMRNDTMIQRFASNVAIMLEENGVDGVDIDCEYPGGNGADHKQVTNSDLVYEIDAFPKLLAAIRTAIGPNKVLSVAAPGLERDMIAYTGQTVPLIAQEIDFMNIMTYDLMNRRDTTTTHQTSVQGSLDSIDRYLGLGLPADKANLGFAFYAKYFILASDRCTEALGCPTVLLEDADGADTGMSGALTFERRNAAPTHTTPTELGGACGPATLTTCPASECCSAAGFCGYTAAHCGAACQPDYGACNGSVNALASWRRAQAVAESDERAGARYAFERANAGHAASFFWSYDTPALVRRKFRDIVAARALGGVMAFSLAEDSDGWDLLGALNAGVMEDFLSGVVASV